MEETYCSDEIEVVLVDSSGPGPASAHLDDSDTVKIIITMSCDLQTAAQLEESVKQSLLENAQVVLMFDLKHLKLDYNILLKSSFTIWRYHMCQRFIKAT